MYPGCPDRPREIAPPVVGSGPGPRTARRRGTRPVLAVCAGLALAACSAAESAPVPPPGPGAPEPHVACLDRDPLGNPYFGELHVHTSLSFDAWAFDTRAGPDDAYAFARGRPLSLPPFDAEGHSDRELRIDRPLDFAAVTDHAELFGESVLCTQPGHPGYDLEMCRIYRGEQTMAGAGDQQNLARMFYFYSSRRAPELCGADGTACRGAAAEVWAEIRAAAERWYDRSEACEFTTFVAYEYSVGDSVNLHRNVVFKNANVPEFVTSSVEAPEAYQLWEALRRDCLDAGTGCDVLAIPHNSNLSNGQMFYSGYPGAADDAQRRERAALRARVERLAEIFQIKGDSECRNGLFEVLGGPDEACDFEKLRSPEEPVEDCGSGFGTEGGFRLEGCVSRLNYVRYALLEGLRQKELLGVNPLKLGIVAATDTHLAAAGAVSEAGFPGTRAQTHTPAQRLSMPETLEGANARSWPLLNNPGGLAGVWAPENTREALFEAMRRRETFGTSGPRIAPRLYASWQFEADLCDDPKLVARASAAGVPMGSDLPPRADGRAAPALVFSALGDPAAPQAGLERLQVVKGWLDDSGRMHQSIHDVAVGSPAASEPPPTCGDPRPRGAASLCAVWSDPDFDPSRAAVYYGRVLQVPSCRWSELECNALPESERPEACSDGTVPSRVRERAWTSPIWYDPDPGS